MPRFGIQVELVGDQVVCHPPETHVKAGDTVAWAAGGPLRVTFLYGTPFIDGIGPFGADKPVTVMDSPPLQHGEPFAPSIEISNRPRRTHGRIIFD
jgi:hypothetical protein